MWFCVVRNAARELEELRVSLVSELRTSEGAKRQQQQFCGPSVALTFNFLVSVGIILMNKLVSHPSSSSFFSTQYNALCG